MASEDVVGHVEDPAVRGRDSDAKGVGDEGWWREDGHGVDVGDGVEEVEPAGVFDIGRTGSETFDDAGDVRCEVVCS